MSWADHFNTYEEACHYYGVDTPEQCRFEAELEAREEGDRMMDQMEAGVVQPGAYYPDDNYLPF